MFQKIKNNKNKYKYYNNHKNFRNGFRDNRNI